jgi:hypothetical protein
LPERNEIRGGRGSWFAAASSFLQIATGGALVVPQVSWSGARQTISAEFTPEKREFLGIFRISVADGADGREPGLPAQSDCHSGLCLTGFEVRANGHLASIRDPIRMRHHHDLDCHQKDNILRITGLPVRQKSIVFSALFAFTPVWHFPCNDWSAGESTLERFARHLANRLNGDG